MLISQNSNLSQREVTLKGFMQAYNEQNYKEMKRSFYILGRLLPIKSALENSLSPKYKRYGKMKDIRFNHQNNQTILGFSYDKSFESDALTFTFNRRNKIKGVFFKLPEFKFSIKDSINNPPLNISSVKIQKIDSLINLRIKDGFNGNLLIQGNDGIVYKKCVGYADFKNKTYLNDSSVFELASCSKQFTAVAILILNQESKLQLDDYVSKYISDFPYKKVTIRHLLNHTSGIPDYIELVNKYWDKTKFASNQDIVDLLNKYKPKLYFQPNEEFEYSNTGYAMLSIIIENVSGKSYGEYLRNRIFEPVGMRNSLVYNTRRWKKEYLPNYAFGYTYSTENISYVLPDSLPDYNYVNYLDRITGDGTINSSIVDLGKWNAMLRKGEVVKNYTIKELCMKHQLNNGNYINYGFGQFIVDDSVFYPLMYHGGGWPGYASFNLNFVNDDLSIIILSNNEYDGVTKLAQVIAEVLTEQIN